LESEVEVVLEVDDRVLNSVDWVAWANSHMVLIRLVQFFLHGLLLQFLQAFDFVLFFLLSRGME